MVLISNLASKCCPRRRPCLTHFVFAVPTPEEILSMERNFLSGTLPEVLNEMNHMGKNINLQLKISLL